MALLGRESGLSIGHSSGKAVDEHFGPSDVGLGWGWG